MQKTFWQSSKDYSKLSNSCPAFFQQKTGFLAINPLNNTSISAKFQHITTITVKKGGIAFVIHNPPAPTNIIRHIRDASVRPGI
jgi:hypothetical protein